MATEVLTTTAGASPDTPSLYPAPGLKQGGNNCWLNSAFQVVCNLSYLKDAVLNLKQPTSSEMEAAACKAYMFIVASYILIALGAILAVGSVYIAFVASPLVAVCAPILPIVLGILCHSYGQSQWVEDHFKPLIDMVKKYDTERQTALVGSVASIDTQAIREWLFHATFQPNASLDAQLIQHAQGSQEDPANFFLYLFDVLNFRMPAIKSKRTYYNAAKEEVGTSEITNKPDSIFRVSFDQEDRTKESLSLDTFFERELQLDREGNPKFPTATYSKIKKKFKSPPEYLPLWFPRNHASYEAGKRSLEPLINTPVTGLDHYRAPATFFSEEAEYETDAFIVHGGSEHGGHYVAYVRDTGGNWWLMNDDKSTIVLHEEAMAMMEVCHLAFMSKKAPTSTE